MNTADAAYCLSCGRAVGSLLPGIPLGHAEQWAELFQALDMFHPRMSPDQARWEQRKQEGKLIPGKNVWLALKEGGFPVPNDPLEPWILAWFSKGSRSTKSEKYLKLKAIAVSESAGRVGGKYEDRRRGTNVPVLGPVMPRQMLGLYATRCRIGGVRIKMSPAGGMVEMLFSNAFTEISSATVRDANMVLQLNSGGQIEVSWSYGRVGLPLLPRWAVALAVIGQDEPMNQMAVADMAAITRRNKAEHEQRLESIMHHFAKAITESPSV